VDPLLLEGTLFALDLLLPALASSSSLSSSDDEEYPAKADTFPALELKKS
jgi:hypothetical protein